MENRYFVASLCLFLNINLTAVVDSMLVLSKNILILGHDPDLSTAMVLYSLPGVCSKKYHVTC
jgi:hypothetical protein